MSYEEKLCEIIKKYCPDAESISKEQKLIDELGLDSLNLVELLFDVETEFGFITEESFIDPAEITTVEDIISLIKMHTVLKEGETRE